jgi:hypothetical protein
LIAEYKLDDGYARTDLSAAMRRLILAGQLRRDEITKGSDRKPIYGLKRV